MMYHIPAVLSPQEVDDFRAQLQQADWVDGRATTGDQGALVKKNQQVDTRSPLFNRYQQSETYGFHVDGAVRSQAQGGWMRTDLSATLFLSAPESYDGGELVVNDTYGQHTVKLPAGDLVLYPSSSLHCVMPVTQGVRVASFLWIQSMIRDDKRRSMLFELDRNIQTLKSRHGESDEVLSLLNLYHNLLREWSEI